MHEHDESVDYYVVYNKHGHLKLAGVYGTLEAARTIAANLKLSNPGLLVFIKTVQTTVTLFK